MIAPRKPFIESRICLETAMPSDRSDATCTQALVSRMLYSTYARNAYLKAIIQYRQHDPFLARTMLKDHRIKELCQLIREAGLIPTNDKPIFTRQPRHRPNCCPCSHVNVVRSLEVRLKASKRALVLILQVESAFGAGEKGTSLEQKTSQSRASKEVVLDAALV